MNSITTHVLDTSRGRPAAGVPVTLEERVGANWVERGRGVTDDDGRLRTLLTEPLTAGTWRITFDTTSYFGDLGVETFYPEATIVFAVRDASQHYHVPLLLSPWGYATYRGS